TKGRYPFHGDSQADHLAVSELHPNRKEPTSQSLFWKYYTYIIGRMFFSNLLKIKAGGGGGSRTRVRKCYWSRDYMLIRVHALGITQRRSRPPLRTDKKRLPLA